MLLGEVLERNNLVLNPRLGRERHPRICASKSRRTNSDTREKDMNVTDQKKCAHPQCSCPVSQGQEYCSEACEISAAGIEGNGECGCDHPQCQMAA
jgi:hypothetical protein